MSSSDEVVGPAPIRVVNVSSWTVTLLFVAIFVVSIMFLATAKYARKETVFGIIEPSNGALRLVSAKPAVVDSVDVEEGSIVTAGAPIIRLRSDPTTDSGQSLGTLLDTATQAESADLRSQMAARVNSTSHQDQELSAKENGLTVHKGQLVEDLQIAQQRLQLQEQSLESFQQLNERKIVSDLQYRDRLDTTLQARQAVAAIEKDRADTDSAIEQIKAERARLGADLNDSEAQLRVSNAQLDEKRASNATETEIVLTAPKAGRILALQAKPGTSVTPGTTLAVVMPQGSFLKVQLWAPSKAAGFVRPGNAVRLMFDAFPYQRFGVGHGQVTAVADAPTAPNELPTPIETKEALYRVDVSLKQQSVDGYGRSWPLTPGMRVTADMILDQRSFLEWILDPFIAAAKRSGS